MSPNLPLSIARKSPTAMTIIGVGACEIRRLLRVKGTFLLMEFLLKM
jgi:hypothetical protein